MKRLALLFCLSLIVIPTMGDATTFGQENVVFPPRAEQRFQPVRIRLPEGAIQSFAVAGTFADPIMPDGMVGLLVGSTYRFRIDNIPYNEGHSLYPSIRLLDRLNAPVGKELDFPIIVDLTQEDLDLTLSGKFVTRIIYLENPTIAAPVRSDEDRISRDIAPGANPLAVAETMGLPIAVVRVGARIPDQSGFFGSPAFKNYEYIAPSRTIVDIQ